MIIISNKKGHKTRLLLILLLIISLSFSYIRTNFYKENLKFQQVDNNKLSNLKASLVHDWTKFYGTTAPDYFFDIKCDNNDNLFLAGRWGNYYAYLLKLDTNGIEDWNWTWDGGQFSDGWSVAIDEENDFEYLAGYYGSYPGPYNVCLTKLDFLGNEVWTTTWDNGGNELTRDVALDAEGNIYIVGSMDDYGFLTKFNKTDGSELWNVTWVENDSPQYYTTSPRGIDISPEGDIYVTGQHTFEYSVSGLNLYYEYFFITKFNSTGSEQWEQIYSYSGTNLTGGWDIVYGNDGYIYAVGGYNRDISLVKLTTSRTQVFSIQYNFSVADEGFGLALDSDNNIYISGGTYNSSTGDWEARMLECSNSGTLLYNRSLNYVGEDRGYGVAVDSNNNAYYCGHATLSGNQEQFLTKMSPPKILPGPFTLNTDAELPIDPDGEYTLTWTDSPNSDYYNLYESSSFISEINDSVDLVYVGLTNQSYQIQKVQNGTYFYAVVAFNGNGNQSSNCESVKIGIPPKVNSPPQEFTLSSNAESPIDTNGNFDLIWTISTNADNYSIYVYDSPIVEINSSVELLTSGIQSLSYSIQKNVNGTNYYVVLAFNYYGNASSNCIGVEIGISNNTPDNPQISFGEFYLYISLVTISVIVILIKKKQNKMT